MFVVAVVPKGGSEPALLRAYADALAGSKAAIRLRLVSYGGVRESAEALSHALSAMFIRASCRQTCKAQV
jgi:hypothetical protein